jgi:hypothetical protein
VDSAEPKAVVVAAYQAANAGRYAEAATYLAPSVTRTIQRARETLVSCTADLRVVVVQLGRGGGRNAARRRGNLRRWIRANDVLLRTFSASPRGFKAFWDGATRQRTLAAVRATKQVIRGRKGRVYLSLTLADGTTARDSEPVVLVRGRWHLG